MLRKRNSKALLDLFWVSVLCLIAVACEDHVNAAPVTQYVGQGHHVTVEQPTSVDIVERTDHLTMEIL